MKIQSTSISAIARKILMASAFVTVLGAGQVMANGKKAKSNVDEIPASLEVKYLGRNNADPIFQINLQNDNNEKINISLVDEEGNIIFSEKLDGKLFTRKFQFNNHGDGNDFNIKLMLTYNDKKTMIYKIANQTRTVEDVVVSPISK